MPAPRPPLPLIPPPQGEESEPSEAEGVKQFHDPRRAAAPERPSHWSALTPSVSGSAQVSHMI